jgi:ankyrin repeat protein
MIISKQTTDINASSELNREEVEYGITELHLRAALNRRDKLKKVLAEEELDVNIRDIGGNTPLHYAARYNNLDIIAMLYVAGAEVNAQNNNGQTALHFAFQAYHPEAVEALRHRGASTKIQDNDGIVPGATPRLRIDGRQPIPLLVDPDEYTSK